MSYKPNFSDAPEFSIIPDGEKLFEEITVLFAYYDPFFEEHLADFEDAERALKAALKGQSDVFVAFRNFGGLLLFFLFFLFFYFLLLFRCLLCTACIHRSGLRAAARIFTGCLAVGCAAACQYRCT